MEPTPQTPQDPNTPAEQNVPVTIRPTNFAAPTTQPTPAPTPPAAPVSPETQPVAPLAPATPVTGGTSYGPANNPGSRKKLLILAGGGLAALLAVFVGAYFMLYLPTTPSRLYATGLERTGEALDAIVEKATTKEQLKAITSSEVTGDVTVDINGNTMSGKVSSTFDRKSSDSTLSYKADAMKISAQIMTNMTTEAKYPDIYFKVTGINTLDASIASSFAPYDDKWIGMSSTYLASLAEGSEYSKGYEGFKFNADDVTALAKIVSNKTSEYVFTANPTKAVFDQQEYIETIKLEDGSSAHRYSVKLNKAHAEAFCVDLANSVLSSPSYKRLLNNLDDKSLDNQKKQATKNCADGKDSKDESTYAVWISTKTKLLHKVRITEANKPGEYAEIGQNFTGGDTLPVFFNYHSDQDKFDLKSTLTTDFEKNTTLIKVTANATESKTKVTVNLSFKPFEGKINITPPAGAIPIEQLLGDSSDTKVSSTSTANSRNITQASAKTTPTSSSPDLDNFFQNLKF